MKKTLATLTLAGTLALNGCPKDAQMFGAIINGDSIFFTSKGKINTLIVTEPNKRITTYVDSTGDLKLDYVHEQNLLTNVIMEINREGILSSSKDNFAKKWDYYLSEITKAKKPNFQTI